MADKQKTTIEIGKKTYLDFKMYCKNHKLPMNVVLEVLIENFNDNQRSVAAKIKKYGKIKIAKQKLEQAQGGNDGSAL